MIARYLGVIAWVWMVTLHAQESRPTSRPAPSEASAAESQGPENPLAAEVRRDLGSKDPRTRAWAAYRAGVFDVEDAAVDVTVMGSVELGVLGEESELSAHATAPRARSRSAVVLNTRRPTARSTPHIGLSSA